MKPSDRNLGMDRPISRRDLLLGMGASAASAFVPGRAFADEMLRLEGANGPYYPPGLTGLRGKSLGLIRGRPPTRARRSARLGLCEGAPTPISTTLSSSVEASAGSRPRTFIARNIRTRGS